MVCVFKTNNNPVVFVGYLYHMFKGSFSKFKDFIERL